MESQSDAVIYLCFASKPLVYKSMVPLVGWMAWPLFIPLNIWNNDFYIARLMSTTCVISLPFSFNLSCKDGDS